MNENGGLIDEFTTKVIEGFTKKNKTVEAHGSRGQMACDPPIIRLRRSNRERKRNKKFD